MKIYVQYKEGEEDALHWRQQVTLPKTWMDSPCERLKRFIMDKYNKACREDAPLVYEEWHLSNETDSWQESLGSENLICEVVGEYDNLFLRQGAGVDCTDWRRSQAKAAPQATAPVIHPVEYPALQRLRQAIEDDDEGRFKAIIEDIGVSSPHELLIAETDVRDESEKIVGSEWHSVAGRYAWDIDGEYGQDKTQKVSVVEFARNSCAEKVLRLIDLAERMGRPIVSGERERSMAEIQASAKEHWESGVVPERLASVG
mmetsp:Transcript_59911/g.110998  ORF Transcript_59911/g.110998 Transcript_59911/m.110998 type:complete len:258 (+) Transcript_59911:62-835(+)